MSRNFEVLCRVEQEETAIRIESTVDVSALLDGVRPYTADWKASSSAQSEILKLVRTLFVSSVNSPHNVVFCGVDKAEGSGRICAAAARLLAGEVSTRVCLVNSKVLGSTRWGSVELNDSGVPSSKRLDHNVSVPRQIDPNLWSVSPAYPNGVSNGGAEQLCSSLLDLRKEFGYLLIDAPPLCSDIIASVLGRVTDGVVLVLEANTTRKVKARTAKEILDSANVSLLGTVLNNRTFPIPASIYRWF